MKERENTTFITCFPLILVFLFYLDGACFLVSLSAIAASRKHFMENRYYVRFYYSIILVTISSIG